MVTQGHIIVVNGIVKPIPGISMDMNYLDGMYGLIVEIIHFIHKEEHGPLIVLAGVLELLLMNMNLNLLHLLYLVIPLY